ncbi:MAG: two-component system NtrC family sensor kinase [Arcticibacterium sp.]|jgi:two-component system NtrC family sensor kinase
MIFRIRKSLKLLPIYVYILLSTTVSFSYAQSDSPEALLKEINQMESQKGFLQDTAYFDLKNQLGLYYANNLPDSAFQLLKNVPKQLQSIKYKSGEVEVYRLIGISYQTKGDFEEARRNFEISAQKAIKYNLKGLLPAIKSNIGITYLNKGNYAEALRHFYEALKEAEKYENNLVIGTVWNNIGLIHFFQNKFDESISDYLKMLTISKKDNDIAGELISYSNIGETYLAKKEFTKALENFNHAFGLAEKSKDIAMQIATSKNLGIVYSKMNEPDLAIKNLKIAHQLGLKSGNKPSTSKALIELATILEKQKSYKKALEKGLEAAQLAEEMGQSQLIRDSNEILSKIYRNMGDGMRALEAYEIFKNYSDTINNFEGEKAAIGLKADFEFSKKEFDYQKKVLQQRWLLFSAFAALVSLLVIFWIVNRNRKRARKNNELLKSQNEAIEKQKVVLEETLNQLKTTQKQLIHSEKMASLGELTAGIAHEIQNPLNFVNNFSEVSTELLDDLSKEIKDQNWEDVNDIIQDLGGNLNRINEHGQRASDIVKGMLEHSRGNSGKSEMTDINALTNSTAKLAHQANLALNKSVLISFDIKLGSVIPSISLQSSDISRVLLNLINNAFQSVEERASKNIVGYLPSITVTTKKVNDQILITVKDNGLGIPEDIREKIFHPFFTTKPSGKGTGLGLSLAYDIAKAHGGDLKVKSELGEGAEFTLSLKT